MSIGGDASVRAGTVPLNGTVEGEKGCVRYGTAKLVVEAVADPAVGRRRKSVRVAPKLGKILILNDVDTGRGEAKVLWCICKKLKTKICRH